MRECLFLSLLSCRVRRVVRAKCPSGARPGTSWVRRRGMPGEGARSHSRRRSAGREESGPRRVSVPHTSGPQDGRGKYAPASPIGEKVRADHTCVAFPRVMSGVMLPTLIGKIARKVRGAVPRLPLARDICAHIVPRGVGNGTQKGENWAQSARKLCGRRRPHFARFHGVCGSPPRCVVLDSVGCATARSLFARRTRRPRRPAAIKGTMTQWHNGARTICPSSQYGLVEQLYCLGSSRPRTDPLPQATVQCTGFRSYLHYSVLFILHFGIIIRVLFIYPMPSVYLFICAGMCFYVFLFAATYLLFSCLCYFIPA